MPGTFGKTDKLDAQGLASLLYLGKLPSMWIPPASVRDERELPPTRMTFAAHRTRVENHTSSTLATHALSLDRAGDILAAKREPDLEDRIVDRIRTTPTPQLIQTIPGPAKVLAIVIDREIGAIHRFAEAKSFTNYCGLVPKLSASAGRAHFGSMIKRLNTCLKWTFIEAANVIVAHRHQGGWRAKYVVHLFELTRRRKGHAVAVGATARYLAESTCWVLKKKQPYREPPDSHPAETEPPGSLSHGQARAYRGSDEIRDMIVPPLANLLMPH